MLKRRSLLAASAAVALPARAQAWPAKPIKLVVPYAPGHAMVSAANPLAAQTGLKVLKAGGSAVDAAVAIQAVLGLVEPQSSGPLGGAFMTFYDAKTHQVTSYMGREKAPAGATPTMFESGGRPMGFGQAVLSGRAYATLGGNTTIVYAASKNPNFIADLELKDTRAHWAAPVPKDNPKLRAQLQDALDCMKKDGTMAKFYEKWFNKKPEPDDLAVVITPGYGPPGMPGYDPTPHELNCG